MPARLNRRRYREVVKMLKEVIANQKTSAVQRLRAAETLLAIYDRHDRTEEKKRAKLAEEPEQNQQTATTEAAPEPARETAEQAAERFLKEIRQGGTGGNE